MEIIFSFALIHMVRYAITNRSCAAPIDHAMPQLIMRCPNRSCNAPIDYVQVKPIHRLRLLSVSIDYRHYNLGYITPQDCECHIRKVEAYIDHALDPADLLAGCR